MYNVYKDTGLYFHSLGYSGNIIRGTDHTENTSRGLYPLLCDVTVYAEVCIPRRCLETDCITPFVPPLLGADEIENTASSIVACWTLFTELLPGNALIKSATA
jgi:hypothetical protein